MALYTSWASPPIPIGFGVDALTRLSKEMNATFCTLIPKVPNPEELIDYRLICLVGYVYKLPPKVLSNRLKIVLPLINGPF